MKTSYAIALPLALFLVLTTIVNTTTVHSTSDSTGRTDLAQVKESYAKLPLSFVANYGQADKQVKFTSRGNGYSIALSPSTFMLAVTDSSRTYVIKSTLLGGNPTAKISGLEPLSTKTNYFIGNDPRRWKTNIPSYAKVKYEDVYPKDRKSVV